MQQITKKLPKIIYLQCLRCTKKKCLLTHLKKNIEQYKNISTTLLLSTGLFSFGPSLLLFSQESSCAIQDYATRCCARLLFGKITDPM